MRLYASILLVLSLLFATPVHAQEFTCDAESCEITNYTPEFDAATYTRYRLPSGHRCVVDGQEFQCFALDEYRQLLEMDVDLRFYDQAYPLLSRESERLQYAVNQLLIAVDEAEAQILTLSNERTRLRTMWSEENRLRLEAENRPQIGNWVSWGISALEAVVITVLAIVMGVSG